MSLNLAVPTSQQPVVEAGGVPTRPYFTFFQNVVTNLQSLSDQIGDVTTTPSESPISENANVIGAYSIYTQGVLKAGIVRVLLQGDVQTPGNTQYYGSDGTGERGWYAVSDALDGTTNITLTVGADGVTTFDLADLANSGTGAALVKLTRDAKGRISGTSAATTSDLAEGSNLYFTNARASSAAPVQSVNGYTGAVALTASDVGAATTAQGAKADSAVQSIVAGTGVAVDNTDPQNPVVSATGSGSGDVVGPASATDGDVALFDGTTGKLLKDGGSLGASVRSAVLTGLSTATSAVIAATDTVLSALGKLQAQITDNLLPKGYIDGLQMQWVSGTALTVKSGAAYIEGSSKVLRATADIAKTGLSLTASTWHHVYLCNNAGTPDVEIVTTAPASPYNGTARSKTGDASRRYVGSILTDTSGNIYAFRQVECRVMYLANIFGAPFLVAQNLTSTVPANISCAGVIPITSRLGVLTAINSDASVAVALGTSDQGYTLASNAFCAFVNPSASVLGPFLLDGSQIIKYMFRSAPTGTFAIRVSGYVFER